MNINIYVLVRSAKFVARKQWLLTGSDDMNLRVYNYNTMEKLKAFEAHSDYIRCIVDHPTLPYVLSSSDDMLIKLWDWDKNWQNIQVFEGHSHYVMMLAINPKDTNTFASASLDRTIKVWGFGSTTPYFTLEGHDKGVNAIDYYIGGDKPYLISGADDKLVKIWDYQNKTCVQTLEGHTHNVSLVCFHPELPIIVSGSEDGTVRIWHSTTYRLEKTLNYGMERVWGIGYLKSSNLIALGYDEGTVVVKLGREEPAVSMDQNGKIIWAKHNEIQTVNLKQITETSNTDGGNASVNVADGERLVLSIKELGNCEIYPQILKHNPNGRFVVVCGDGEYIIYTALAWRNKSFGQALEFVWGVNDSGEYAVRESPSKIKLFKNFKEVKTFKPTFSAEGIYGGTLLAVRSKDFVSFYDWELCRCIRKIDIAAKNIYWSDNGELVSITTDSSFYVLKFNKEIVNGYFATGAEPDSEGIEDSFELLHEISEKVRTAIWVGDCFIYTNANNRVNYCVGGQTVTISHLDKHMYLLGYIPNNNRLYLIDKAFNVVSYSLHISIINYQTAVLRDDFETANKILPKIPMEQRNRIALFLDTQGHKEQALEVSIDPDHKFELAVQLNKLEIAHQIAIEAASEQKWKQLADLALQAGKFQLAEQSLLNAEDLGGLLLLYTSTADAKGMNNLANLAIESGKNNVAFVCYFLLRRIEDCINLLCDTGRVPEAAFLARTYLPSQVSRIVKLWRQDLQTVNEKAAESLADPMEYENLFPDLKLALKAEAYFKQQEQNLPSSKYPDIANDLSRDLIDEVRDIDFDVPSPRINNNDVVAVENKQEKVASHSPSPVPSPVVPQKVTEQQPKPQEEKEEEEPVKQETVTETEEEEILDE